MNIISGRFTYQFNRPGIYYYWSGYVDSSQQIALRGVVEVLDSPNERIASIQVKVNGQIGKYTKN
jgi:hypothetical protein